MRKIREVLHLRLEPGLSICQISASTKTSVGAIQKLLSLADALNLNGPLPKDLDDGRLAALFYPGADPTTSTRYQAPDWATVHQELKRKNMAKHAHRSGVRGDAGCSNYTYAEATWSQGLRDWLSSHVRTFEFFGGIPNGCPR
jgi:transposase